MEPVRMACREELTPVAFLERAGTVYADRLAAIDGDRRFTYREMRARARRMAHALARSGVKPGDRVAYLAFNSEPLLVGHFGVPMAGGVLVAINTRLNADEVGYILAHSGARLVFHSPELAGLLPAAVRRVDIATGFEAFLGEGSEDEPPVAVTDEYDTIAIDYTSGTTGRPKGVMYHHRGAYLNALAMVIDMRLDARSRYLWTLPMFHCNGWTFTWATAAAGAASVCVPRVDPAQAWQLFKTGAATHFCGAPTVLTMLANHPSAARLERPVRAFVAGAPPSPTIIEQMSALGFELEHVYGLTETYGPFTINLAPPDAPPAIRARQGVPNVVAGRIRVLDLQGRDVPADGTTMGEVCMRGNAVAKGYFENPDANDRSFEGGWFHSGDIGVMHPDGTIELRDRKKDIIISGGENISTIEVEQAVVSHPAVLEAAVIAIPDPKWGEVPKAFVTLKERATLTADELIAHCRARLAAFKCPKAVEFGPLPKTSTGKIQKYVLRDREWAGRDKRIN